VRALGVRRRCGEQHDAREPRSHDGRRAYQSARRSPRFARRPADRRGPRRSDPPNERRRRRGGLPWPRSARRL
jgi:hypothetical protein